MFCTQGKTRFHSIAKSALAAALATSGLVCGASSIRLETAPPETEPERIYISGKIEKGDDEKFIELATARVRTVVVSSRGGDYETGLSIGAAIHKLKMAVEVDGECFSACAQFIFPAGSTKSIRARSFLAFHAGDTTLKKLLLEEYAKFKPARTADAEGLAERVTNLRARHALLEQEAASLNELVGIQPNAVEFFVALTSPRNLRAEINAAGTSHRATMQPAPCDFWVPDAAGLRAIGIDVQDFKLPPVASMARRLGVSAERIYFGPAPSESAPVQIDGLCAAK